MAEHIIGTDRAADESILNMLTLRQCGYKSAHIGVTFGGLSPEYVRTVTNRVRDADIAESTGADRAYAKKFWGVA
jgi:hypothetical protein